MTLLVISPGLRLAPAPARHPRHRVAGRGRAGGRRQRTRHRRPRESFGFERVDLPLGRGLEPRRHPRPSEQPPDEGDSLRGFFDATRLGVVPTLPYQATERLVDLMWQPVETARATLRGRRRGPSRTTSSSTTWRSARGSALTTGGIAHGDVVLGHPTALPVGDEVYGRPPFWPAAFRPDPAELERSRPAVQAGRRPLHRPSGTRRPRCSTRVAPAVADAFALHGPLVLYNYPARARRRAGAVAAAAPVPGGRTARGARRPPRSRPGSATRSRSST